MLPPGRLCVIFVHIIKTNLPVLFQAHSHPSVESSFILPSLPPASTYVAMGANLAKIAFTAASVIATASAFAPSQSFSRNRIAINSATVAVSHMRVIVIVGFERLRVLRECGRLNSASRLPAASLGNGAEHGGLWLARRLKVRRMRCGRRRG